MTMKWPSHGGQPEAMKRQFKLENTKEILDFSANINPYGPPTWVKQAIINCLQTITTYPDPSYSVASQHIAEAERIDKDQVLVTNGGAEAIFLVAKYFEGKNAMIVQPTFLEYERACHHYHLQVKDVFLSDDHLFELPIRDMKQQFIDTDVVFLCRPNNPSGTVIDELRIRELLAFGLKTGTTIVVDEAFVDFLPESIPSLTPLLSEYANLILLRSMTKMYAIPGLRVGYMLTNASVTERIKQSQIPWSVNSLADSLIPNMLADSDFVAESKRLLSEQFEQIRHQLLDLEFDVSPSRANFYLLQDRINRNETDRLFHYLLSEGILARHTHNFKGLAGDFLRFAVRSPRENQQLINKLEQWRTQS